MGLLTFSLNVTLDGFVDRCEGIADDETHAFFTRTIDEGGAMLWGCVTCELMESYWPAVARARRLDLVSATPLRNGALAVHYRRARVSAGVAR